MFDNVLRVLVVLESSGRQLVKIETILSSMIVSYSWQHGDHKNKWRTEKEDRKDKVKRKVVSVAISLETV